MSGFGYGFSGIVGLDVTGGCSGGSHGFVTSGGVVKTGVCGGKSPKAGGVENIGTVGGSCMIGVVKTGGKSWTGGGRIGGSS